jgi:hypothetical protein
MSTNWTAAAVSRICFAQPFWGVRIMDYRHLGRSVVKVPPPCLGAMMFAAAVKPGYPSDSGL